MGETVAGIVDGGCDLRFTADASEPLAALGAPGHNATNMAAIFDRLLAEAKLEGEKLTPALRHDLVDVARQTLDNLLWDTSRILEAGECVLGRRLWFSFATPQLTTHMRTPAFHRRDYNSTEAMSAAWKQLATDLDTVLGCDQNFMVGPWIAAARATAEGGAEEDNLEYNARNQITLWGPKRASLADYARKQWNGLLLTYHLQGKFRIRREMTLIARGMKLTRLCSRAPVAALLPAHVGQVGGGSQSTRRVPQCRRRTRPHSTRQRFALQSTSTRLRGRPSSAPSFRLRPLARHCRRSLRPRKSTRAPRQARGTMPSRTRALATSGTSSRSHRGASGWEA